MTFIKRNANNPRVLTKASTSTKPKLCRTLRPRWNLTTSHVIRDSDENINCSSSFPTENDYDDRPVVDSMIRRSLVHRVPLHSLDLVNEEIETPQSKKFCFRRINLTTPHPKNATSDHVEYTKGDSIVCTPTPNHRNSELVSLWSGFEPPFLQTRPATTEYLELPQVISRSLLLPNF